MGRYYEQPRKRSSVINTKSDKKGGDEKKRGNFATIEADCHVIITADVEKTRLIKPGTGCDLRLSYCPLVKSVIFAYTDRVGYRSRPREEGELGQNQ